MNEPPVSPDPLAIGLRRIADARPVNGSYCTPEESARLSAVTSSAWYQKHLARHTCHAFDIDGSCLDCGSAK